MKELGEASACVAAAVTTILPGCSPAELRAATIEQWHLAPHGCYAEHLQAFKQQRAARNGGAKRRVFDCAFSELRVSGPSTSSASARGNQRQTSGRGGARAQPAPPPPRTQQAPAQLQQQPAHQQHGEPAPRGSAAAKAAQRKAKRKSKGGKRVNTSELD